MQFAYEWLTKHKNVIFDVKWIFDITNDGNFTMAIVCRSVWLLSDQKYFVGIGWEVWTIVWWLFPYECVLAPKTNTKYLSRRFRCNFTFPFERLYEYSSLGALLSLKPNFAWSQIHEAILHLWPIFYNQIFIC